MSVRRFDSIYKFEGESENRGWEMKRFVSRGGSCKSDRLVTCSNTCAVLVWVFLRT